jgi:MFS family permease
VYARVLLAETREELVRAEGKASILLAALGVAIGALIAALLADSWSPYSLNNKVESMWWLGVGAAAAGIAALASALMPRTKRKGRKPKMIAYFGDVTEFGPSHRELKNALFRSVAHDLDRSIDQLIVTAGIVRRKYKYIKFGIWAECIAIVLCTISVLASDGLK